MILAVVRAALLVRARVDVHLLQSTTPLAPPPGRHWKIYAICGPVLVISGIVLRVLGDAGTGNFLVVMGATYLVSHFYMRFGALDVVDAAEEFGRFIFPGGRL